MAAVITLDINAKLEGIDKALGDLTKGVKKNTDAISNSFSNTFNGLAKAAVGLAAVVAGAFTFKEAIAAASESDRVLQRLNVSLKVSGDFTQQASDDFQDLASSIESATNISDEYILSLVSKAKAIGIDNQQTKSLVKASVDLAAVLGQDVQSTFDDLTRTLNGDISRSFAKALPELKNLGIEALTSGKAIEILGSRFKGAAADLNNTFDGASKSVSVGFENILESSGKLITQNPLVVAGLKALGEVLFKISKGIESNLTRAIHAFNQGLITTLQAIKLSLGFVSRFSTEIISAGGAIASLFVGNVIAAGTAAFVGGFKALTAAVTLFGKSLTAARIQSVALKASLTLGIGLAIEGLILLFTKFENPIQLVVLQLKKASLAFLQFTNFIFKTESVTSGIKSLSEEIANTSKSAEKLATSTDTVTDSLTNSIDKTIKYIDLNKKRLKLEGSIGNATEKASKARQDAIDIEIKKQREDINTAQEDFVKQAASNPIAQLFGGDSTVAKLEQTKGASKQDIATAKARADIAVGLGLFNEALKGAAGATKLISSVVGSIADTLVPGIGAVASEIFNVLSQGPAKVQELLTAFLDAIPTIINNVILSIPVIFETIFTSLPEIISKLIESILVTLPEVISQFLANLPTLVQNFIFALIAQLPNIAQSFAISLANQAGFIAIRVALALVEQAPLIASETVKALIAEAPNIARSFVDALVAEAGRVIDAINPVKALQGGGSGILNAATGGLSGILGFAEGGRIPNIAQFKNDGAVIRANAGEQILGADLSEKLDSFLSNGGGAQASGPTTVNLVVGEEQLASVILNLNRRGFRLA